MNHYWTAVLALACMAGMALGGALFVVQMVNATEEHGRHRPRAWALVAVGLILVLLCTPAWPLLLFP